VGCQVRVGITGAHGVGKTTLAGKLARELNIPLIKEQARAVASLLGLENCEQLAKDKAMAAKFQIFILYQQIKKENELASFISDGTFLDFLAYWTYYGLDEYDSFSGTIYRKECLSRLSGYDFIVYVPPEMPLKPDGFRLSSRGSRNDLDRIIRFMLEKVNLPVLMVSGDPGERVRQVLKFVGSGRKGVAAR
jgi:nicotinamide riboside kinase